MLPFGSITSLVPLLVLACAYFIYFGAAVVNKHASQEQSTSGKEIIVKSELSFEYRDFRTIDDNETNEFIADNSEFIPHDFAGIFIIELLHDKLAPPFAVSAFSPRPPPAA